MKNDSALENENSLAPCRPVAIAFGVTAAFLVTLSMPALAVAAEAPGTAIVGGTAWSDANGDGVRDPDEPGLPGVVIYSDRNGNGALETAEPHVVSRADDPSTADDESGRIWLEGLSIGTHTIRAVVSDGSGQTFPQNGAHDISVGGGEIVHGADFGSRVLGAGSLQGQAWYDGDNDMARNGAEPGLPGVTIFLDANFDGAFDDGERSTVTLADDPVTDFDEAGLYGFSHLSAGRHAVRVLVPAGFAQTFPPVAHEVDVRVGASIEGVDFGSRLRCDVDGDQDVDPHDLAMILRRGPDLPHFLLARSCAEGIERDGR